jgi:hypothetical protein
MSVAERLAILSAIARVDYSDVFEPIPGTKWHVVGSLDDIPPEARLAIQEIRLVPTQHGVQTQVKLYSRTEALDMLNKMSGEYKKVVQHEGEVFHRVMALPAKQPSEQEWRELYAPKLPASVKANTPQKPATENVSASRSNAAIPSEGTVTVQQPSSLPIHLGRGPRTPAPEVRVREEPVD